MKKEMHDPESKESNKGVVSVAPGATPALDTGRSWHGKPMYYAEIHFFLKKEPFKRKIRISNIPMFRETAISFALEVIENIKKAEVVVQK